MSASLSLCHRVVKTAAAAENINSGEDDVELTSDSSSCQDGESGSAQQTVPNVSSTLDSDGEVVTEREHPQGIEELLRSSSSTLSNARDDLSPVQTDSEYGSPSVDNCSDASSVESPTEVDKLAEDDLSSDSGAVVDSVPVDADKTNDENHSAVTTDDDDDVQCESQSSSCNELTSSLIDSVDICEQGLIGTPGCGVVSAADYEPCDVSVSTVSENECTLTPCNCYSSSEVAADDVLVESPMKPESEDVESSQCRCDTSEPDLSQTESEPSEPSQVLSESFQPINSCDNSTVACEEDLSVSTINEVSTAAADVVPIPSLNVNDLQASTLSSSVSQVTPCEEMEAESKAVEGNSPTRDGISLILEADCEHGGKASKLDQPSDSLTSDNLEASDTGALHMSVGFQSTPHNDRAVMFDGDSDMSRDTSIGVLMVCDDDGLVSSVNAKPSAESSEDGVVVSSDDGDYETLVPDTPASFTAQLSTELRPLDVVSVAVSGHGDKNLTEASEVVTTEDLMLCEVESKSREMEELLADISQTAADTSRDAQLSETSIFSHEDSEFFY